MTTTAWATSCEVARAPCVAGTWRVVSSGQAGEQPVRLESAHIAVRYADGVVSADVAQKAANALEGIWQNHVGLLAFPEPFCDVADKHKVNVNIDPKFAYATGSGTGDRDPAMWLQPVALQAITTLAHEFTHCLQYTTGAMRDSKYVGWFWENHAEYMAHTLPGVHTSDFGCLDLGLGTPHLYWGTTRSRYCTWHTLQYLKDRYCPAAVNDIWARALPRGAPGYLDEDPASALMRSRGWSIEDLNAFFVEWAVHSAFWDYRDPDGTDWGAALRGALYKDEGAWLIVGANGGRLTRTTRLVARDDGEGRFEVHPASAPQRWGFNVVPLTVGKGAASVTATLRGFPFAPDDDDSAWAWALVAAPAAGGPSRVSRVVRGRAGSVTCCAPAAGERLALVAVAVPRALQKISWDQPYATVRRYPWAVELEGARPAGQDDASPGWGTAGRRWPNGGGWVADGAQVDATAYVGPQATVLAGRVADQARIEDFAVVAEPGVKVAGSARVGALTVLVGDITVDGAAQVMAAGGPLGARGRRQVLAGGATLWGDLELNGDDLQVTTGVFTGYLDAGVVQDPAGGRSRTQPDPDPVPPRPWKFDP